jgi:hypothetical protein
MEKENPMKGFAHASCSLLFKATLIAGIAFAPATGRTEEGPISTSGGPDVPFEGCFYYEHASFGGMRRDIPRGLKRNLGDRWNDEISSIACSPGCGLLVGEHHDFGAAQETFWGATQYVGDAWNDDISSLKVVCH